MHGFRCPYKHLQCNSVIKLYNEHKSVQIQWPTCRSLGNYTKVFIHSHSCSLSCLQHRNTVCSNKVYDILQHCLGVRICPATLQSLSAAALLGNAVLEHRKAVAMCGNAKTARVSTDGQDRYRSTSSLILTLTEREQEVDSFIKLNSPSS